MCYLSWHTALLHQPIRTQFRASIHCSPVLNACDCVLWSSTNEFTCIAHCSRTWCIHTSTGSVYLFMSVEKTDQLFLKWPIIPILCNRYSRINECDHNHKTSRIRENSILLVFSSAQTNSTAHSLRKRKLNSVINEQYKSASMRLQEIPDRSVRKNPL